ncbi:MAG: hypothetical protein C0467_18415 [Planctomycetaceae bacterium]|nr:hypothetical protein [Planctomycetaceae bacterium]
MKRICVCNPLVAVLGLMVVGSGCATVVTRGGQDQKVTILSDTPGATLVVDGQPTGTAPGTVSLTRKTEHKVEVVAPGYETAQVTVRRRLNPWVFGNLVLGGPIGLVIDVISDSTHSLSPDQTKVTLRPLPAAPTPMPAAVVPSGLQTSPTIIQTGAIR